jgi:hypothetical protein
VDAARAFTRNGNQGSIPGLLREMTLPVLAQPAAHDFPGFYSNHFIGGVLEPRLEYQVEWGLRRPAEMPKATRGDHFLESFFSGLRTQSESNFLRQRSRSAQQS